jgi:hypothetical protein
MSGADQADPRPGYVRRPWPAPADLFGGQAFVPAVPSLDTSVLGARRANVTKLARLVCPAQLAAPPVAKRPESRRSTAKEETFAFHSAGKAYVMDFIVQTAMGEDSFDGDARYAIENGVVTAYRGDGSRVLYAAGFWQRLIVSERPAGETSQHANRSQ